MRLNDIPEDDTRTQPCARPMRMTAPIRTPLTVLKMIRFDSFVTKF